MGQANPRSEGSEDRYHKILEELLQKHPDSRRLLMDLSSAASRITMEAENEPVHHIMAASKRR